MLIHDPFPPQIYIRINYLRIVVHENEQRTPDIVVMSGVFFCAIVGLGQWATKSSLV